MAGIIWAVSLAGIVAAADLGGEPASGLAAAPAAPSVGTTGTIEADWAAGIDWPGLTPRDPARAEALAQPAWLPPREGRALQQACRDALRRWARPGQNELEAAARELLALYQEVVRDTQLAVSQREELRLTLRGRLVRLAERIERRSGAPDPAVQPDSIAVLPGDGVLAQWGGMGGWGGLGGPQGGMPGGAGWGMIGPQGGFAPEPADNGQQLVDLIEKTIAPRTWVTNGGFGSIYYWRPGRAIVVRQNQEVHGQIGDLLWQMQQLGQ